MSDKYALIQAKVSAAIEEALAEYDSSLVNKWVCLIDNTDAESGQRTVWTCTSDRCSAWDSLGLLTWAVQLEQAAAIDQIRDDGEDP